MKIFKFLARLIVWCSLLGLLLVGAALTGAYLYVNDSLPKIDSLADYRPPTVTQVFADDGSLIAEFAKERRIVVPYESLPPQLVQAFIAAEDSHFFEHQGIDFLSILRAAVKNFRAGRIVQGGSTITQQVTKGFLLTPERKYTRKFKEAILAYRIEKKFSKEDILYLYLNQIYLGHAAYGVQAAAENYFGKDVDQLTLAESAMLAGLPQAPSRYSPYRHFDRAKKRQAYVLKRMVSEGYITSEQEQQALDEDLTIHKRVNYRYTDNAYFTEQVRRYLEENFSSEALYTQGLQVQTTLNLKMQKKAQQAVQKNLRDHDKRRGYRGPERQLPPEEVNAFLAEQAKGWDQPPAVGDIVDGVVETTTNGIVSVALGAFTGRIDLTAKANRWAGPFVQGKPGEAPHGNVKGKGTLLAPRSLIRVKVVSAEENKPLGLVLEQEPLAQGALVAMDPRSGEIKAMVGGYDFAKSQFNRAIQARRLPGSAIKPLIYAAALDKGYTPASMILDSPVIYEERRDGELVTWKPKNYENKFYGPTRFRSALVHSRNVVTIKVLEDIGVRYAANYLHKLGIKTEMSRNLTLGLGASHVTPLEMTRAYSTLANGGVRIAPIYIARILDRDGKVLHSADPADFPQGIGPNQKIIGQAPKRVITPETAYLITNIMESVVQNGTGRIAKKVGRPLAGKTGTTNDLYDAWFIGYAPQLATASWVGYDNAKALGRHETGAKAAAPAWVDFMATALESYPVQHFPVPDDIEFHPIDKETGLLTKNVTQGYIEAFAPGTAPKRFVTDAAQPKARDFFRLEMEGGF